MDVEKRNIYEVRAFPRGIDRYNDFIKHNFIALGWSDLGDLTGMNAVQIKEKIVNTYTDCKKGYLSQIVTFFVRLKYMKIDDIILIPYIESDGPTITVATVTKTYHYDSRYIQKDMTHQVGIKPQKILDRNDLAEKFVDFNNSLKARLTLTEIDKKKHQSAVKYIEDLIPNKSFSLNYKVNIAKLQQEQYKASIKELKSKIDKSSDELAKKAFIFSALSINEAYLTTLITNKILTDPVKNDEQLYDVISNNIINKLYARQMRQQITDLYFENAKIKKEYIHLRNTLAHSINSAKIEKGIISYKKHARNKDYEPGIDINKMFTFLEDYAPKAKNNDLR